MNQKLAMKMLGKMGHTVTLAGTGREALRQWRKREFDLVFMDVQMPEMDGLEATMRIRQEEKASAGHVPIVAMTAYAMSGDKDRCLNAGMDNYITKPVSYKALQQVIAATLILPAAGVQREMEAAKVTGLLGATSRKLTSDSHPGANWTTVSATYGYEAYKPIGLPRVVPLF